MSKPNRFSSTLLYGIAVALLALLAFLFVPVILLILFVPAVVYLIWDLYNRMTKLEKRLKEKEDAAGAQP